MLFHSQGEKECGWNGLILLAVILSCFGGNIWSWLVVFLRLPARCLGNCQCIGMLMLRVVIHFICDYLLEETKENRVKISEMVFRRRR